MANSTVGLATEPSLLSRSSVYVVDDDADMRSSTQFLLKASDISAETFASGSDFVGSLARLKPGCILLDIRMPGMNGFEVLKALADHDIKWPAIVMTAHGDLDVAIEAMKLGAADFIEKPFREDTLLASLELMAGLLAASDADAEEAGGHTGQID